MQTLDDGQFEKYLRQFVPFAPEPVCTDRRPERWYSSVSTWALAAVAVVTVVAVVVQFRHNTPMPDRTKILTSNEQVQVLTVGRANTLLSRAPSLGEALDRMAFQPETADVLKGKVSALTILSEEKIKP